MGTRTGFFDTSLLFLVVYEENQEVEEFFYKFTLPKIQLPKTRKSESNIIKPILANVIT